MNGEAALRLPEQPTPERLNVEISVIRKSPEAQPRAHLSTKVIESYAEAIQAGAEFPPIVVFRDSAHEGDNILLSRYWLADGYHRVGAHEALGRQAIRADVYPGGLREAVLYSVSANALHGLQRTDEDKRRAVRRLLDDKEWSQWSDRAISRLAGVSHTLVAKMRQGEPEKCSRKVKRGKSTYEMKKAAKKEKVKKPSPAEVQPAAIPLDRGAAQVFAKEVSKLEPAAAVGLVVALMYETHTFLPSPESSVQLLRKQGLNDLAPQRIVQIAKWFEGIAFALDGR